MKVDWRALSGGNRTDASTHRFFTRILYTALAAGAVLLLFNDQQRVPALALYAVFAATTLWAHHRFYRPEFAHPHGRVFLAIGLLLTLSIQYFDHTGFVELYLFIVIGDALLAYGPGFSLPFAAIALASYAGMLYFKTEPIAPSAFWQEVDATLFACAIYVAVLVDARHNIAVGRKNRLLAEALREKTARLEQANAELRAHARELERTADLRAREALMQELHDKLGHLLTTAAVGVQAAQVLSGRDADQVKTRLDTVALQLQTAMQALRDVIRGQKEPEVETSAFSDSLTHLMQETEKYAGVRIERHVSGPARGILDRLGAAERSFLYNALMEGLTNGIRHGGATEFHFTLDLEDQALRFLLGDNGTGFESFVPGVGLEKMQRNAARLGAGVSLRANRGGELEIRLPLHGSTDTM